jgi:hypothetical protein
MGLQEFPASHTVSQEGKFRGRCKFIGQTTTSDVMPGINLTNAAIQHYWRIYYWRIRASERMLAKNEFNVSGVNDGLDAWWS